jgi:predicted nucleic acid-binding protein
LGSSIDPEDALIAGVAWVHGERVLTRDVKRFRGFKGVKVESCQCALGVGFM